MNKKIISNIRYKIKSQYRSIIYSKALYNIKKSFKIISFNIILYLETNIITRQFLFYLITGSVTIYVYYYLSFIYLYDNTLLISNKFRLEANKNNLNEFKYNEKDKRRLKIAVLMADY